MLVSGGVELLTADGPPLGRGRYERLKDFLISKGFKIGKVDTTLFTKDIGKDLFVCQILPRLKANVVKSANLRAS